MAPVVLLLLVVTSVVHCSFAPNPFEEEVPREEVVWIRAHEFRSYVETEDRSTTVVLFFTTDDQQCHMCQVGIQHYYHLVKEYHAQRRRGHALPDIYFAGMALDPETYKIAREMELRELPTLMIYSPHEKEHIRYEPKRLYNPPKEGDEEDASAQGQMSIQSLAQILGNRRRSKGPQATPPPLEPKVTAADIQAESESEERVIPPDSTSEDAEADNDEEEIATEGPVRRDRGGFGQQISEREWLLREKALQHLDKPMVSTEKTESDYWSVNSLIDWLIELKDMKMEKVDMEALLKELEERAAEEKKQQSGRFLSSKSIPRHTVLLAVLASAVMYLYQTFIGTPDELPEFTQKVMKRGLKFGLYLMLALYFVIVGGAYYTIASDLPFIGMQEGRISFIMPSRYSQFGMEVWIILVLGVVFVLSFIRLMGVFQDKTIPDRTSQIFAMLILLGTASFGVLFVYMNKNPWYLYGTQLHVYLAQAVFGKQIHEMRGGGGGE